MKNQLKLALKVLARRKFFTFVSLFGVTLTLGVLLVGSAMLDQTFVPQGVEKDLDRTLTVRGIRLLRENSIMQTQAGYEFLERHVRQMETPERVAIFSNPQKVASYRGSSRIELTLKRTDQEFWNILDFDFIDGAPLSSEDVNRANFVAVINASTSRKLFGSERALGKWMELDGQRFRVIGVVRDVSSLQVAAFADVWVPISATRSTAYKEGLSGPFMALIEARAKAEIPKVKEEFEAAVRSVEVPKEWDRFESYAETRFESLARMGPTRSATLLAAIIASAMLLFMTLPAVNLVNLNLSRILERASEIGVRKAFGASSRNLVGQFVTENVVLTLIGGLLGFLVAEAVLAVVNRTDLIPYAQLHVNVRVFGYAILLALAFGLMSGVYPAWKMSRLHPVEALKGASR